MLRHKSKLTSTLTLKDRVRELTKYKVDSIKSNKQRRLVGSNLRLSLDAGHSPDS